MATPSEGEGAGNGRFGFRLRLSSGAERALLAEWDRCRWVWNECVAQSKAAHRAGATCGPARLDKMPTGWRAGKRWLRAGASVPQQQTIRDFAKSRAKALADIKAGLSVKRRAGMPRMKKRDLAAPTMNYTRRGFRLRDGRLHLAGGIAASVVWSRDLPADPSSVRIYRDSLGHWYASFVVAAGAEPLPATGRVIGVDWGVTEAATTTSDEHDLPHSGHGKKAAARLARYQRQMARRRAPKGTKQTKGYRQAAERAAKAHKKVVRDFDAVAVEDFRSKFLAKSTMARKAADAAIGETRKALIEMGREHGRDVRLVDPAHTTMDCGDCGARAKHRLPLSERIYTCTACGTSRSRDKNSARVMLVRAGLDPDGADGARPPAPLGQEAA